MDIDGIRPIEGGWHIKELDFKNERGQSGCIHIERKLVNFRIIRWWGECEGGPVRNGPDGVGYCYKGLDLNTLALAIGQALSWDGTTENPPLLWIKEVHTGRYIPEGYQGSS